MCQPSLCTLCNEVSTRDEFVCCISDLTEDVWDSAETDEAGPCGREVTSEVKLLNLDHEGGRRLELQDLAPSHLRQVHEDLAGHHDLHLVVDLLWCVPSLDFLKQLIL